RAQGPSVCRGALGRRRLGGHRSRRGPGEEQRRTRRRRQLQGPGGLHGARRRADRLRPAGRERLRGGFVFLGESGRLEVAGELKKVGARTSRPFFKKAAPGFVVFTARGRGFFFCLLQSAKGPATAEL